MTYCAVVKDIFGYNSKAGEIGLELELEGFNLPTELQYHWDIHNDGSLRPPAGGTALEYVLRRPNPRDDLRKVLTYLDKYMSADGVRVLPSQRASTHVHLNQLDRTFTEVFTLVCVYAICEQLLIYFCGPERIGNMFCLRFCDAEYLVDELVTIIRDDRMDRFAGLDNIRYSAVNLAALAKFGSLEFRAMRNTADPKTEKIDIKLIETWVRMLLSMQDAALKFRSPQEIIQTFSEIGPRAFLRRIFPEHWQELAQFPNMENAMFEGMRYAQDIAFARQDWTKKDIPAKPKLKKFPGTLDIEVGVAGTGGGWANTVTYSTLDDIQTVTAAPIPTPPLLPRSLTRPLPSTTEQQITALNAGAPSINGDPLLSVTNRSGYVQPRWGNISPNINRVLLDNRIWQRPN